MASLRLSPLHRENILADLNLYLHQTVDWFWLQKSNNRAVARNPEEHLWLCSRSWYGGNAALSRRGGGEVCEYAVSADGVGACDARRGAAFGYTPACCFE